MNKIYKVIYNKNKHRYEVVSELAKSHGGKCKTTVATAGDTNWLRRLWMRVRGGANKSDEDGNPVTMSISRAAMVALMCISVWSAAAVSSSWVEAASTEGVPVSVKYDETTGTIKIVKTDPDTNVETILATYAVGGSMTPIIDNGDNTAKNVIALGQNSTVLQSDAIAIGTDAHAGNASGSATQKGGKIAIGSKTVASGDRSIALGNQSTTNNGSYNIVQGDDSIGIGTSTSVFGYSGVSIGRRNIIGIPDPALVSSSGVLTTKSNTPYREANPGGNSVIVGAYNVAYGNRSSIIGTYSRAMGSNSVAIGSGVQSLSDGAIAIGKGSGYEFEDGSRHKRRGETEYYGRDWELPPEYKVLKQVLSNDIAGDEQYKGTGKGVRYENGGILPKYNNYGAGSSDPGGFIVEGKNALGIGTYTQVRGDSAIGLATGEMTADLSDKDKSAYARDMRKIMDMEETLYDAKEALQAGTGDTATLKSAVKAAEESLATAKKNFRETYLTKYSFVDGDGALGVGRQILAQGDRSMAVGDFAKAISSDAIAYGGQTLANGTNSMAIGGKAHVGTTDTSFDNSMAIGSHTDVQAGNAVALGAFSQVTGQNSLALGFGKQSGDAITYNRVSGKDSTLIGSYGNIAGNNSILIGSSGSIANDRVVGLGNNINIEAADPNDQENNTAGSVFLGDHAGYVKDSKRSRSLGQVDVVGSAGKMELTESLSSTKGALRDYTKDFIYIYMLERQDDGTKIGAPIAVRSDFAGGDSTVGVVSVGSTYQQQFNSLEDIKDYHSKVGSLITVPVDVTVQVTKNGVPLGEQQQTRYFAADSTRDTIYADNTLSEEDKAKVWDTIQKSISSSNTTYTVFETRRIQNVAPGLIGLNSTDAINGSQLFATNQMLGNLVGSLKKTLGDSVTVTEDGEITVAGDINTLGWIAKAGTVKGSNGKVEYDADKKTDETEEAHQARIAKLKEDGYIVDASKVMTFKAGKNIGLVQKPGEFSISTIDTPSFTSVELRGETKEVNGSQETPVTMMDSSGMQVYTETVTPDGSGTTTTKKVSTTVNNEGVTTDGTVKVTNGEDGGKDLVSLGKGSATTGETDQNFGTIHVDGKQGADGTITIDRGTKSLTDTANVGKDREQKIDANNPVAGMDRITYTTKGPNDSTINHEVATLDDGFFLTTSKDVTDKNAPAGVKLNNTIKFTDGANTKVSRVTSDNNGVHSLHIDVNGLPVVYTDEDGNKLTKVGDKFYKDDQFDNGTLKPNATPSDAKNISIVNPDGSISKTDGSAPTTVNNVGSSIGGDVNNGAPTGSTINGERGTNSFIDKLNKVGSTENDAISKNAVVTTGDLKNLADTPLFFSGDAADGKNGNVKNTFGRKLSEEAKIVGGVTAPANLTDNNIGVVSNGSDTLTVKLAKNLKDLDSTTYTSDTTDGGDAKSSMKVDGNGVRFVDANGGTVDNTPTFTTNGITGGNKTITDVASGIGGEVEDAAHDNANTFLENVNKIGKKDGDRPAADAISEKVVVNAKDLKNLVDTGFKLNTSGQPTDSGASTVKIGETINVVNGANTKVSAIDSSVPGTHTFHIDVTGMPVVYTDEDGNKLTKVGDKFYKDDQFDNGTLKPNATPSDAKNISIVNPDGSISKTDGSAPTTVNNVGSSIGGDVNNGAPTGSTINGERGTNSFIDKLNKVGSTENDAISKNAVVTTGDLKNLADTPLFFSGDAADGKNGNVKNTFGRKLSEEAKIVGGVTAPANLTDNNIGVVSNGSDTLTIKLAKQLTGLDSATYTSPTTKTDDGDATSTMKVDGNGIRFVGDNNAVKTDAPSLTTDGITGGNKQITNVGSGLKNGDTTISISDLKDPNKVPSTSPVLNNAVNVGDLKNIIDTGFKLNTSGQPTKPGASTVKIGDTINIIDGANTKVSAIDDSTTTGTHTFHIDVTGMPISYTDNQGNALTKIGDNYYKNTDITNGVPNKDAVAVDPEKVTDNIKVINKDGSTTNPGTISNVKSAIDGVVGNGAPNGSTINGEGGTNTFIDNVNRIGADTNGIDKNSVVTTGDLKNLADTSLFFSGDAADGKNGNVKNTFGRKLSEEAKIVGGVTAPANLTDNNIGVVSNGSDTLTIKLAKQLTGLDSATYTSPTTKTDDGDATSTMKVDGNGIRFVDDKDTVKTDAPSLTTDGIDAGNKQITNVGSGLVDNNGKTIKPNELLKMTDANNPVLKNAVNVGDLKKVAAAAKTEVTGTGEAFVTDTEAKDGHIIYNVHVDKILSHKDAAGNELVRGGDGKYYTNEEIKDKTYIPSENKWYSNRDITDGKPNKDAQAVTPDPVDQSHVKTSLVNPNTGVGDGTDTSMTLDNVKSGIGGDAGNGIKDGTTVDGTQGNNTFIKNLDNVGGTGKDAIDKTTVVNAGDLKNLAETPLFFSGDAADGKNGNVKNTFGRKLSEEAKIVGGVTAPANLTDNNIGVVSNGSDTLTIKLAKQLTGLDSATYTSPTTKTDDGDATSTMKVDGNGIRFVDDKDTVKTDAPSLTTDGIDGGNKQITNVGSGLKDGDTTISMSDLDDSEKWPNTNPIWNNAVNVGDLKKAKDAATTEVTGTGKAIVTKTVGNKGQNIYNVHVDPVVDVVATDGKTPVVRSDDGKYYNPSDIENKIYIPNEDGNGGNWYNKSDIGPNGKPNTGAPVQEISPVDVKNNFVNPNGTGSIVLDNVKSGIGGAVKDADKQDANTFLENVNKIGKKDGDQPTADAISENVVVNAKDLKNVVDTGFKLNTSGQGTNPADTVKIGDTIQVVDGKNTTVSAITHPDTGVHEFHIDVTGLPVTYTATETDGEGKPTGTPVDVTKTKDGYQKADGTPLIKINENGKDVYYTADQLDSNVPKPGAKGLTITDNIRLINPKDGTGATKITNVAAGTDDTDAVNVSQLKKMAAGASTEVTGTGKAIVTQTEGDKGQAIYNVHVDPVVDVVATDGKTPVVRGDDGKYYNPKDIADKTFVSDGKGGGSWYNKTDVTDGKPNTGANPQTPVALKQSDIKTSLVNPNAGVDPNSTDNSIILDNVKSGIGGDAGNNGIPKDSTIDGTTGDNSFIKNLDTVGKSGGIDKNTVVNAGDLKNLADTPLFFTGDSADGVPATDGTDKNTFGRKLSEEMKIVGGVDLGVDASASAADRAKAIAAKLTDGNIGVISDGTDTLTVKLAKELKDLDSVKVSNGKDGKDGKNLVTIGKEVDDKVPDGKDGENGIIGLDGKNGSEAVITIDRGTKSITDEANLGENPSQPVSGTNKSAKMDRITYTTKGANGDINHEVATLDDGFMLTTSTDVSNSKAPANVKLNNTIKFTDGANTKVSTVTSKDGVHELHVDVSGLPMTYVDKDGKPLTKIGDKFYKSEDLDANGVPKPNTTPVEDNNVTSNVTMLDKNANTNTAPQINNVGDGLKNGNTDISVSDLKDATKVPVNSPVWNHAVNVNDLKKVIDAGFKLNTSGQPAATSAATVAIGDTINVIDGANTKVSAITSAADGTHTFHIDVTGLPMTYTAAQFDGDGKVVDGSTVNVSKVGDTYQTEDGTKLVNVGGKYYKPNQLDSNGQPKDGEQGLTVTNSISLQNPNSAADPATLKNVGSGLVDKNGKPVSIDEAVGTNAVNVNDLRTLRQTATTEVTGTGAAEVTKVIGANGQNIYNVYVDKLMTVKPVDANTNIARGGDGKYYNADDIAGKTFVPSEDKWYNTADVDANTGKPLTGKTPLDNQPTAVDQNTLKNSVVNPNGDGPTVLDNVKSGIGGEVKDPAHNNKNTFIDNINKVVKKSDDGTVAPGAISEDTVVNAKDLKNVVDTGFKLNTSGHSGDAQTVKIGETIKVVDGANTKVSDITSKDGVHEFHIDVTGLPMTYVDKDGNPLVKVGDKFYLANDVVNGVPKDNAKPVADENVTSNVTMLDKDGKTVNAPQIRNVGSSLVKDDGERISMKDLNDDTAYPDTNPIWNSAVNVKDLKSAVDAATTEVTTSGVAILSTKTANDGHTIYNVHVDPVIETKGADGSNVVRGDDGKYYKPEKIQNKTYVPNADGNGGNWYNADDVVNGVPKPDAQPQTVKPADIKNSIVNPNSNDPIALDNVKSGIGGEVKDPAHNNKNTFIDNINKVVKKSDDGTVAPGAISEDTVVNAKDLKNVVDTGFKLNTSGHSGDAQTVKIGDTIKVVDGANTRVSDITSKDGVHTFHIDVTGLPVTYTATKTDAKGTPTGKPVDVSKVGDGYQLADGTKLVKVGDKYYTPDQLENGQPKPDEEGLTIKESVSLTQDNSAPATLERVGSGRRNGMKANAAPMAWDKILNPSTADDKAKVDNMLTNAANIGDVRDAIKSITDGTSDNASGGFGLTGNNGDVKQDLGKTITVKGGIANKVDEAGQDLHVPEKSTTDQNTYVNVKDVPNADGQGGTHKEMVVEIAKDLTDLDSVTVGSVDENGNGGTVINKDGMTVKDATGNNSTSIGTGTIGTSKTDKDGNTSSTNIDGGTITSEKKDKDGNKQSTTIDGSHMTLENKDKDGKLTGPKTEISNEGMTITPVDKDGNAVTDPKKQVSITDKGLNNGGNQIINVDSGLKNDKGQKVDINDIKDDDSMLNNAVNVGDLKEAMNKAKTEVGGSGAADVIPGTGKDGNPKYTVHVDKLVEAKADDGKAIVRGEDNKFYYKDESLKQGKDGKWYPKDKLDADGNPEAGVVGKNIPILGTDPVPADNLKTSLVNPNDPNSKVKLDNIKSAIGGDVGNGAGSEDKVNGADGTNSFIDNLDKVGKKDADGNLAPDGIADDAAVTTGDLKNLADTPLFFGGDSADGESTDGKEHTNTFDRKLGKQINIKGEVDLGLGDNATAEERKAAIKKKLSDGNIGVISNGKDTLTVKLSKDLKDLNTIEVNDSISVGKDGDSTVIKGSETTSSFTEVATGPDGQPLYEVDKNGEVVRDANGDPIPVTKTSSTTTKGGTVTIKDSNVATGPDRKPLYKVDEKGNPVLDEKGHKIPITESSSTTTGGGKLATDVENVKMVDGKPVTSHETTTIDGSHFESKDKDGNYTTINGGEIKSYDKDTNGSVTIKGDSLTASSKDENGHDKVTKISSDGFNSTATTFERDGNGQLVLNPDTGLPKEVTNKTNINADGFTATRTDSEGNEVLKTTMQNGNIAIEKPQPIIDPTTGEAYKVLDKNGNWVPAHGYTKISDNGFEIQGINQSGTGISKVRLSSEGLDNGGNRITHVAEGIAPDDAVNVSQLRDLTQNINNDIANVGANAAALAGLKAIQYDPLEPTQIMAAVGTYRGKQAAALGIAHYKNEDTMFHMGVSIGSDHTMANIGVTYKFGRTDEKKAVPDRYKAGPISSTYVLQDEMVALKEENARMRANDEKMNAAYDEILNLVKQLKQDNEEMKKKLEKLEKK